MKMKKILILSSTLLTVAAGISFSLANKDVNKAEAIGNYSTSSSTYSTTKTGNQLMGWLHDTLVSNHKNYTTYDDCKNATYVSNTDYKSSSTIYDFYTHGPIAKAWGSGATGTWNREHVWCQSLTNGLWGESGGGSDLHHIRPTEPTLNTTRNNNPFGEVSTHSSSTIKYAKDTNKNLITAYPGGYLQNGVWEPMDHSKGDVARILFYVYVHYNKASRVYGSTDTGCPTGTLDITDIVAKSTSDACFDLLLEWNELDPVDSIETRRNEYAAKYTGVRNPFIDFPNYANRIWGTGVDSGTSGGTTGGDSSGGTTVTEPSIKNVSSLSAILNDSSADLMQKYSIKGLTVSAWKSGATDGSQYGNFYVTDGTTTTYVYGASASSSIISWNGSSYQYNTQTNFLSDSLTSSISIGDTIDVEVIRSTYNSTVQLHAYIKAVNSTTSSGGDSSSGDDIGGGTVITPPTTGSGTSGKMVINEDYAYTRAASLTSGKYIFATRTDTGYYILDPASVTKTARHPGVFTTSLTNYADYYLTVTKQNATSVKIYADGPGSNPSHTDYYLGGNTTTTLTYSTSYYTWTFEQSYYSFGTYNAACIMFKDHTNDRNLHFRAGSYNAYGCYASSNYNGAEYACPYLYSVDTAYNYLIEKLSGMSCSDMASSTFFNRITYLYSKLSTEEINNLMSKKVTGADGSSYTAYQAYSYAISYYSGANNQLYLLDNVSSNKDMIIVATFVLCLASVTISIIYLKKRAKAR